VKPEGPSRTSRRNGTKKARKNARVRNRPHRRHWFARLPILAQFAIVEAAYAHSAGVELKALVRVMPDGELDPGWME